MMAPTLSSGTGWCSQPRRVIYLNNYKQGVRKNESPLVVAKPGDDDVRLLCLCEHPGFHFSK